MMFTGCVMRVKGKKGIKTSKAAERVVLIHTTHTVVIGGIDIDIFLYVFISADIRRQKKRCQ